MQAIQPYTQIFADIDGQKILEKIAALAVTAEHVNPENKTVQEIVAEIIKTDQHSVLKHVSITVKFVVDEKMKNKIQLLMFYAPVLAVNDHLAIDTKKKEFTCIIPPFKYKSKEWSDWTEDVKNSETTYFKLLEAGCSVIDAEQVLPESLKKMVIMTANLKDWQTFFWGVRKHSMDNPQLFELAQSLLEDLKQLVPVVFDDITY